MNEMYTGYRRIFWGLFLVTFHFNLGPIQILPPFVAYLVLCTGLDLIISVCPTPLWGWANKISRGVLLLSFINLVLSFAIPEASIPPIISLIWVALGLVMDLLLVYYILAGSVEWLQRIGCEELAQSYESKLGTYIVWAVLIALGEIAAMVCMHEIIIVVVAVVAILVRIWLMMMISGLKYAADQDTSADYIEPIQQELDVQADECL